MRADLQHLKATLSSTPAIGLTTSPRSPRRSPAFTQKFWKRLVPAFDRFSEKPVKPVETRQTNLPVQRTGFVGREKEVLRQRTRAASGCAPGHGHRSGRDWQDAPRVQVASGLVERFPGGTHFVPLSSLSDPGLIASVIVQTLGSGRREVGRPRHTQGKFTRFTSRSNVLVLDNFEH